MWNRLFAETDYLHKGISASWARNEVITNNIANIDTPGFKRSEVEFERVFAEALEKESGGGRLELRRTRENHLERGSADLSELSFAELRQEDDSLRYDESNVSIETEMAALAKNTLEYYSLISKLNAEFAKLNMAVSGG